MAKKQIMIAAAVFLAGTASAQARSLSDEDVDAICRVTYAESAGEPLPGRSAVAAVIMTRMGNDKSAVEVVSAKNQFEPVTRAGGDYRRLPLTDRQRIECETILAFAKYRMLTDPTDGADHFQNPAIVAQRAKAGTVKPSLVDFGGMPVTATIGNHRFYRSGDPTPTAARGQEKAPELVSRPAIRSMAVTSGDWHEDGEKTEEGETVLVVSQPD